MHMTRILPAFLLLFAAFPQLAAAQEEIAFAGGTIRIEENADYEKVITFDGNEIGRDYMVFFDDSVEVGGTEVAMISIGPGGNACGANTMMVWKTDNGDLKTDKLPGDCGWPAAAVTYSRILFVPWIGPGEEMPVRSWTPENGFSMAGTLRYTPEPGTQWADLAADPALHPVDYFLNEAFFENANRVLGDELREYAVGLGVSSGMEPAGNGLYAGRGCMPHNCGGADSVLVVDFQGQTAWFAQMRGNTIAYWPDQSAWPAAAREALQQVGGL